MKLTEKQIRDTIARMEADDANKPLARNGGKKTELLAQALAGNASARFVIYHYFHRYNRPEGTVGSHMAEWMRRTGQI